MSDCTCKKPFREGAHEALCPSNNEMEYYHCANCDRPTWQARIVGGKCSLCRSSNAPKGIRWGHDNTLIEEGLRILEAKLP